MQVDILIRDNKPYTYENYAYGKVKAVFDALKIHSRKVVIADGVFFDYFSLLKEDPPDWTLSFEEIFSLQKPFCDLARQPHLYWKNGSFSNAIYYFTSDFGKVGCTDRKIANHFSHPFLPHASEKMESNHPRIFDVVLFEDLIDVDSKRETWKTLFGEKGAEKLLDAIFACKNNSQVHPALIALGFKTEHISLSDFIFELEEYLRAERTLILIESLKNVQIHVFGEHVGNNWLLRLKNRENVHLHAHLPYTEHFEVLKRSKVLIREQAPYADASDEWILHGLNSGCFVFTNPSPYVEELLKDTDCFYHSPEELNEKVKKALSQQKAPFFEEKLKETSWEARTTNLIQYLYENKHHHTH